MADNNIKIIINMPPDWLIWLLKLNNNNKNKVK